MSFGQFVFKIITGSTRLNGSTEHESLESNEYEKKVFVSFVQFVFKNYPSIYGANLDTYKSGVFEQ